MKKWIFSIAVLFSFQMALWIVNASYLELMVRNWWMPNKDELIAVSKGDIDGDGTLIKVLKFKTKTGIRVEFLKETNDGTREYLRSYTIRHPYNGFFEYRGNSIQLAMSDVDGDGVMEVLAPTFDRQLMAHLNVYYYDSHRNDFIQSIQ